MIILDKKKFNELVYHYVKNSTELNIDEASNVAELLTERLYKEVSFVKISDDNSVGIYYSNQTMEQIPNTKVYIRG